MAYLQQFLPADTSTTADMIAWGNGLHAGFAAAGWVQQNDTGQVVFVQSVVSITNASGNGSVATYTYSLTSGPALRVGMSIVITGCTTAGFNGTFTIKTLPTGSTFTVTNSTNVTEAEAGTGNVNVTVTATPVATNTTWGYEIWKSNDALSAQLPICIKLEYACRATTGPGLYFTIGYGSDGAGTIKGVYYGRNGSSGTWGLTSGTVAGQTFECDFAWIGSGGSFGFMWWRNLLSTGTTGNYQNNLPCTFILERTHDASGNDTAEGITIIQAQYGYNNFSCFMQPAAAIPGQLMNVASYGQLFPCPYHDNSSTAVGGNTYLVPLFPMMGRIHNPMRMVAQGKVADFADGSVVPMPLYGTTQNYLMSRQNYGACYMCYGSYNTTFPPGLLGLRWDAGA